MTRKTGWRLLTALVGLGFSCLCWSKIVYRLSPTADRTAYRVDVQFEAKAGANVLRMASWMPGLYVQEDFWKRAIQVQAVGEDGNYLSVSEPEHGLWQVLCVKPEVVHVRYQIPVDTLPDRGGLFLSDESTLHASGATAFMAVEDQRAEPCELRVEAPGLWKVAVALPSTAFRVYEAKDFDELVDSPISMGGFQTESFVVDGISEELAIRGRNADDVDQSRLMKMCRFVTETEKGFFGSVPFKRYVWHIWAREGDDVAGGIEHRASVQMFMTPKLGSGTLTTMFHEMFHAWNVKTIHPSQLDKIDYTSVPQTGTLWWFEGVTDYYASLLPFRYGAWDREGFFSDIYSQFKSVQLSSNRLEVSPDESSRRVGESPARDSTGYKVNYYPTGWLLGLMFDIEIRSKSNGRASLDDVIKSLYRSAESSHGVEEGELRAALVRAGGTSLGEDFDKWVMSPGELPVNTILAEAGLELSSKSVDSEGDPGIVKPRAKATPSQVKVREAWLKQLGKADVIQDP